MTEANAILDQLRDGFTEIFQIDAPGPETDLLEDGILDSFQLVELLAHLDSHFGLRIDLVEIDFDDLRTLERLARLVQRGRH